MSEVKVVEVVAVWVKEKRGAIVKHWTRSDETKTLCGKKLDAVLNHPGVSRECAVCVHAKLDFERKRTAEVERAALWGMIQQAKDGDMVVVFRDDEGKQVGCVFGSYVQMPLRLE